MLLNMATLKLTTRLIKEKKMESNIELIKPDMIGFDSDKNSDMEEKFLMKKVCNLTKVLSQDIEGFMKKTEKNLEELYGMVSTFNIGTIPKTRSGVCYKNMVLDEVRCTLLEWKRVLRNLKAEYKKWRTLHIQNKLLLIQLELDLDECKCLISNFIKTFGNMKTGLKCNDPASPIRPTNNVPEVTVGILVDLTM